jgi:hypothetical protein
MLKRFNMGEASDVTQSATNQGSPSFLDKLKEKMKGALKNDAKVITKSMQYVAPETKGIYEGAIQRAAAARRPIYGAQVLSDADEKINIRKEGLGAALMKSRHDLVKPRRRKC